MADTIFWLGLFAFCAIMYYLHYKKTAMLIDKGVIKNVSELKQEFVKDRSPLSFKAFVIIVVVIYSLFCFLFILLPFSETVRVASIAGITFVASLSILAVRKTEIRKGKPESSK